MPLNLLKKYNNLLELDGMSEPDRNKSLQGIFRRDFIDNHVFFRKNTVIPTPKEGKDTMDVLFDHLTKRDYEKDNHREYDRMRAVRLHWVRHHILEGTPKAIDVFSVIDKKGIRTYIFDRNESYVVVLEPRVKDGIKHYYLITAYHSQGKDLFKLESKAKRRLPDIH